VGWLLDRYWQGEMVGGARVYDPAAYQAGFTLMYVCVAVSLMLILMARETHCRQSA